MESLGSLLSSHCAFTVECWWPLSHRQGRATTSQVGEPEQESGGSTAGRLLSQALGILRGGRSTQRPSKQSRLQVSGSEALVTLIGSPDVGSPADHWGTTMSRNVQFLLFACPKWSMKPHVSLTQIVTMLDIPCLAFMQLTCYLQIRLHSSLLNSIFWI